MAGDAAVPIGMMAKAAMVEATAAEPDLAKATIIKGPISISISVAIRIISVGRVTVGIVTVRIVAVVWVGRIEERISKVVNEEEPIVEVVMMESITVKSAEFTATKATAVKAGVVKTATTMKAATSTEAAVATAATEAAALAVRHHV